MRLKDFCKRFVFLIFGVIFLINAEAGAANGPASKKNIYKVTSKIVVDGEMISSPVIIVKENQKAAIILSDQDKSQRFKIEVMVKNKKNSPIIHYDFLCNNDNEKIHSKPVFVVSNQEEKINIASKGGHLYSLSILTEKLL